MPITEFFVVICVSLQTLVLTVTVLVLREGVSTGKRTPTRHNTYMYSLSAGAFNSLAIGMKLQ